jgi:hypothetical protein
MISIQSVLVAFLLHASAASADDYTPVYSLFGALSTG